MLDIIKKIIKILISYTYIDVWKIGIIYKQIDKINFKNISEEKIYWYPVEEKKFMIADPFVVKKNKDIFIFFEKLFFAQDKGFISVIKINSKNNRTEYFENIIPSDKHLSYPHIFEYQDTFYMIPESSKSNEIALYKSIIFPYKWVKVKTLIDNFCGLDSTLLHHDEKFWLFTSERGNQHQKKLFIFYSTDLLGNWNQHKNNPVKIDIASCRGAGNFFKYHNNIYRPAQDYSKSSELRIVINKIIKLNEYEFEEKPESVLEPSGDWDFPNKLHTISSYDDITVIDSCKTVSIFLSSNYLRNKIMRFING